MHFITPEIRSFLLHESSIESVDLNGSTIVVNFCDGFYNQEHHQLKDCKMILTIKGFDGKNIDSYISVRKSNAFYKPTLSFLKLCKLLNKKKFLIDVEYYSEFEKSILLVGRVKTQEIYFKVTDIEDVVYIYQE